jgi:hypothetical protein
MKPLLLSFLILSLCYYDIDQVLCKLNIVQDQEVTDHINLELSLGIGQRRRKQMEGKVRLEITIQMGLAEN